MATVEGIRCYRSFLRSYYQSWESYFGYQLMLGGAQHYGYYEKSTYWPFPIDRCRAGSKILEAGCGFAQVALHMARQGMVVTAVDILDYHVDKARQNVALTRLQKGQVEVKKLGYHHLESIPREVYDGVYTVQALGHSTHPEDVLGPFWRILKPGGRIALIETERRSRHMGEIKGDFLSKQMRLVNEYIGYPTNGLSREGYFKELLENAGFVDVEVCDYPENILPMLRLCYLLMLVPFFFVRLFGLEKHFVTMFAINRGYLGCGRWALIAASGTKPRDQAI